MPEVVLLQGLPASGKTTFALARVAEWRGAWVCVNTATVREMLYGGIQSHRLEPHVKGARDAMVNEFMRRGLNIMIDDTNLHPAHGERMKALVAAFNKTHPDAQAYQYRALLFVVDVDEAIARDLQRPRPVGEHTIRKLYDKYLRES